VPLHRTDTQRTWAHPPVASPSRSRKEYSPGGEHFVLSPTFYCYLHLYIRLIEYYLFGSKCYEEVTSKRQLWHSFRIYITQSLRGRQRQSSATRERSISGYFNAALAGITKNCCAMDVQETKGIKSAPGRCHYCTIEHTPPTAMNLYTSLVAAART